MSRFRRSTSAFSAITWERDSLAAYCWPLSLGLLALYVNAFPLWAVLSARLGREIAAYMPFALAGLLGLALLLFSLRRRWHWPALGFALGFAAFGLWLADPAFPAKRVHVAEYALLALLLRRAMQPWLGGPQLTLFAAIAASLYGIHDEMLQGLLPERTFGLSDIAVDCLGAFSGSLLGSGLGLSERPMRGAAWPTPLLLWFALLAGTALLAYAMPAFIGEAVPLWVAAPLLGSGAALLFVAPPPNPWRPVAILLLLLTQPLALYPLLTHVPPFVFR